MILKDHFYSLSLIEYKESNFDKTGHSHLQLKVLKQTNEIGILAQSRFLSKSVNQSKTKKLFFCWQMHSKSLFLNETSFPSGVMMMCEQ